jgi:glutaminyl-tRNA synthetase
MENESKNFIEQIIEEDIANGKNDGRVQTRFPPEPNGYLHIGHAKSICLNFGVAEVYHGNTNLRFDDTNPATEETEYVDNIKNDIKWLGFSWEDREYFASDYFPQLYAYAVQLIKAGKAYVDDSSSEEIARMKGSPTRPGDESPYRNRTVEENLELFEGMKNGNYEEGLRLLRAKIDMTSPNMHMRDPAIYRIKHATHHRTGDQWHVYPMYDFAHGLSDSIEGVTHSLCTLEFENHRPLYDWFLEALDVFRSRQIEFARLNLNYTIMSKRKLLRLVTEGYVGSWDDPRMPTISGLRRRGYTPESIRNFATHVGVAKRENVIDVSLLEFKVREHLNRIAPRVMVVLNPVKLTITNYPEGQEENLAIANNPEDENAGERQMPFSKHLFIERDDFMEDPPRKFFRMGPGRNVRLKSAYILHCEDYHKNNETGEIEEIFCTYYPESKSGEDTSGIKAKGTLHWVSQSHCIDAEVRLYDRLFKDENPGGHPDRDFTEFLNEDSLKVLTHAKCEPALGEAKEGDKFQFLRLGYYCVDKDSKSEHLVFNRTVALRDAWAKSKGQ